MAQILEQVSATAIKNQFPISPFIAPCYDQLGSLYPYLQKELQ